MTDRPVERCVCHDVPFTELIRLHRATGADFDELQRQTHAGAGCGLCIPYVKAALATGQARFPVLSDRDLEQLTLAAQRPPPSPGP